jgi:hypothetical protein
MDVNDDGVRDVAIGAYQAVINSVADVGRLFVIKGGSGLRTVNADAVSSDRLARIDGEPNGGQFGSTMVPVKDGNGSNMLAVSALHADGSPWPMTGKIFLFSAGDLTAGTSVASVRALAGQAKDMHLGTFLAPVEGRWGTWLAAGAPTENANTGSTRLFGLSSSGR